MGFGDISATIWIDDVDTLCSSAAIADTREVGDEQVREGGLTLGVLRGWCIWCVSLLGRGCDGCWTAVHVELAVADLVDP